MLLKCRLCLGNYVLIIGNSSRLEYEIVSDMRTVNGLGLLVVPLMMNMKLSIIQNDDVSEK